MVGGEDGALFILFALSFGFWLSRLLALLFAIVNSRHCCPPTNLVIGDVCLLF